MKGFFLALAVADQQKTCRMQAIGWVMRLSIDREFNAMASDLTDAA